MLTIEEIETIFEKDDIEDQIQILKDIAKKFTLSPEDFREYQLNKIIEPLIKDKIKQIKDIRLNNWANIPTTIFAHYTQVANYLQPLYFDLVLVSPGLQKVKTIQLLHKLFNQKNPNLLTLMDTKKLVDKYPEESVDVYFNAIVTNEHFKKSGWKNKKVYVKLIESDRYHDYPYFYGSEKYEDDTKLAWVHCFLANQVEAIEFLQSKGLL